MVSINYVIIPTMLISGTLYAIVQKVLLLQRSTGWNGIEHKFDKPFNQSLLMVIAMMFSLIVHKYWDSNGKGPHPPTPFRTRIIIAIPATFDIVTTTLNMFGLLFINVSIYQMLRGAQIVFIALLSTIFLGKKVNSHEWAGIILTIIALVLIGWAGMYVPAVGGTSTPDDHTPAERILGIVLVLVAQVFHASQVVLEEYLLKFFGNLGALEVIGNEGVAGFIILILVMFPFAYVCPGKDPSPTGGSLENIFDTFIMLSNNGIIAAIFIIYIVVAGTYNIFAMLVLAFTSSLNMSVVDAIRNLTIWVCMIIAAYSGFSFGELWNNYSFMELAGFIILVLGNFTYNGYIKLPFVTMPDEPPKTIPNESDKESLLTQ